MMRLGAAQADQWPLQINSSEWKNKTWDMLVQLPGWVGDARPDDDVGVLEIGAAAPLKPGRIYCHGIASEQESRNTSLVYIAGSEAV